MDRLPRFDETGALPAFSDDDVVTSDDLEPIEDSTPMSLAPIALDDVEEISISEILEQADEQPSRPWRSIAIAAAVLCVAAGALFMRGGERRSFLAESYEEPKEPAPPVVVQAPAPPPPVVVAPPPQPPPPVATVAKTTGTIVTPLWARGRRVWIDGKVIKGHAPKVEAACGKHSVKIGAYSKAKNVDIPCGAEIKISP